MLILPFLLVVYVQISPKKRAKAHITPNKNAKQENNATNINSSGSAFDFACIITAYKQLDIALPLIRSLLQQTHPNYIIYVVADNCTNIPPQLKTALRNDISEFDRSSDNNLYPTDWPQRIVLLQPNTALHSKVKSMQYALQNFVAQPDFVAVFDPDNVAAPNFLEVLNAYLAAGYCAVQGKRTAKNLQTNYAAGDALGEIYKNYVERYAPFVLGSSASIAGSGMAVTTSLFRAFLQSSPIMKPLTAGEVIPAEDKLLQNFLVESGLQIAFATNAVLYDEKVSTGNQVRRQRTRWLYAYFENTAQSLQHIIWGLRYFDSARLIFGLLSVIPPLFILLGLNMLLYVADSIMFLTCFYSYSQLAPTCIPFLALSVLQTLALGLFAGNIIWTLYLDKAPPEVWAALRSLPLFIGQQFLALLGIKKAKKDFLTTQHTQQISIEELINKKQG